MFTKCLDLLLYLSCFYISFIYHAAYHLLPSLFGQIRIHIWRVHRRSVGYSRQHRSLIIAELRRFFTEITHAGVIDVIISGAKVYGIHIQFEDLILVVKFFYLSGYKDLRQLSADLFILLEVHITSQLLRYGASAFLKASRFDIVPYRPSHR